jgi:hypothetical protein
MKKIYFEPELEVVEISTKQILMISGPDVYDDGTVIDKPGDILAPPTLGLPDILGTEDLPAMPSL